MQLPSKQKIQSNHDGEVTPIFIVGAPRTGSTVLYQLTIDLFSLPYISNFTNNHFTKRPLPGLFLQKFFRPSISLESSYGKTKGTFEPSEGSNVMKHWFGGAHPSQTNSTEILKGREQSLERTVRIAQKLYSGKPLTIKNAWNCFRIPYLSEAFPDSKFIWARRDIYQSAVSDLKARYVTKGTPSKWNSATPANIEELLTLPPHEQVIENKYEFNQAISKDFLDLPSDRTLSVWYEDLIENSKLEISRISEFLSMMPNNESINLSPSIKSEIEISENTLNKMKEFLKMHPRFVPYFHKEEAF